MSVSEQSASGIKSALKELLPTYIIDFAFCYMLFFYEPLMMYCTNKYDFWFDFGIIIVPTLKIFFLFFFGSAAVLTGLFFLCRAFSNVRGLQRKQTPYKVVLLTLSWVFVVLYIQGNIFVKHLPALDGTTTDWSAYVGDNVVTAAVCVVLLAVWIFASVKLGVDKTVKYATFLSAAMFITLTVSLSAAAVKNDLFETKGNIICTTDGLNSASSDKNFFIFMVDAQSAEEFSQVISMEERFSHTFDDFTYFPDTTAVYPFTRDAVPQILSGYCNKNEEKFGDFAARSYNNSPFFEALDKRGYDIFLYDSELVWYGDKRFSVKNASDSGSSLKFGEYFTQEMRYVMFKYLPYAFKKAADIEKLNFDTTIEKFDYRNDVLYNEFKNIPQLSENPNAQFSFIHAEGAHVPFNMDENMNRITDGTYLQKVSASTELIAAFLERLKANGMYDNSVIIIMADHGYITSGDSPEKNHMFITRLNPILLIKGAGEKHELIYSDKPVSYLDLPQAYNDLLDGRKSTELFPEAEYPRTRTVIWYEYTKEEHMVEYQTDGKATEWDKFRETGEVFDLPKK